MPFQVNGQMVPEEWIVQEQKRLERDPQWKEIADEAERAKRLRDAAEHTAADKLLIEQIAAGDTRPIDQDAVEREFEGLKAQFGEQSGFDADSLRQFIERRFRIQRIHRELKAKPEGPTDEQIRGFYDAYRDKFPRPELFEAAHIVKYVNAQQDEAAARAGIEAALADLEGGASFAEAAATHSDCKDKGGDLGRFPAGHMVDEFEDALRVLTPGERSGIVRTAFGFHIILLRSHLDAGVADFEDTREEIEKVMIFAAEHEAYEHAMADLRARSDIRWVEAARAA